MDRLRETLLLDASIVLALSVALQVHMQVSDQTDASPLNVAAALLLTLPLAVRRRAPLLVAVLFAATAALSTALGGGLFVGEPPPFASLIAGAATFYALGMYAESRDAQIGAALGVAGLWTAVIVSGQIDPQSFLFSAGLIVATPWLLGRNNRSRALRLELSQREQEQRERVAVEEERARIARELHDVVAHSVGAIVAQAQGARRMLDRDHDRTREALETIERTGRTALDEMRRSLGVLRRQGSAAPLAPQPGMDGLDTLIEQARDRGLDVELVSEGRPGPLPPGVDLSAYRIVQEALTNTLKHAGSRHARVVVGYGDQQLELHISDDGSAPGRVPEPTEGGDGHGLIGMRERVALYGGELHADHRPEGGFVVRASLPLSP
jgi:signal transduction histidine kinase